jgi:hypothetical protein
MSQAGFQVVFTQWSNNGPGIQSNDVADNHSLTNQLAHQSKAYFLESRIFCVP